MEMQRELPLPRLRFAPALPLRGTSLREDGLHEAEAGHSQQLHEASQALTSTHNPYTS